MDITQRIINKQNIFALRSDLSEELKNTVSRVAKLEDITDSLLLASSGTTASNTVKIFEIPNQSMLGHSESLTSHFNIDSRTTYLNTLPWFFMGGCSIFYRQVVSGFKHILVNQERWSPSSFINESREHSRIWSSLVPTQLNDLYSKGFELNHFEGIFIGGDRLQDHQYQIALKNCDPLYETYGASEYCSQLATSKIKSNSRFIDILPFVKLKPMVNENGHHVKTPYHFKNLYHINIDNYEYSKSSYHDLACEDYFPISDQLELYDGGLIVKGRSDNLIKVKGKFFNLKDIEDNIYKQDISPNHLFVTSTEDLRAGKAIVIVSDLKNDLHKLANNDKFSKFRFYYVRNIKKTVSGKIKKDLKFYQGEWIC